MGTVLVDVGDGLWVQNRRYVLRIGGFGFDSMSEALGLLAEGRADACVARLIGGGMGEGDAADLLQHLRSTFFLGPGAPKRRWMTDRELRLALRAGPKLRLRVGPLSASDVDAKELLVQLGTTGWRVGPLGEGCRTCAALWEIQESRSPNDWARVVNAAPHRAAVALAEGDLRVVERAVRALEKSGDGAHWLAGRYGQSRVSALRLPRAANCPVCPPVTPRRRSSKDVAELAKSAGSRLGIKIREKRVSGRSGASFAGLPRVFVSFGVAKRAAKDGSFVGGYIVQAGCGLTLPKRILTARMEVVERACGMTRKPDLLAVPLAAMREPHLPLDKWDLYSEAQYAQPDFPYRRPDPGAPLDWLRAESLLGGRELFVPAPLTLVQVGAGLVATNSTGLAAHVRREDAILNGLREVIERDALTLAWYRGRGARLLDPAVLPKGPSGRALAWLERRGWRASLSLLPGRAGLSVVAGIGEVVRDQGSLRKGALVFGASASASVSRAAMHALEEVVMIVESLDGVTAEDLDEHRDLERQWYLKNDLDRVMHLYLRPEMRPAVDFFRQGPPLRGPFPDEPDDLPALVRKLASEGLEPLVIDLSNEQVRPLVAVQTMILGAQPMAFGTGELRMGTGLLGSKLPRRAPPPPPPGYRPPARALNPYPLPLA